MLRRPMSLPPAVQSVLELFQGPLANVRFADVDAAGLASLAGEVDAAAAEVEAHEATLVELKQSLAQRQEALLALAQQALAYARVYAENNDEQLLDVIGAIALPRATSPRTVKPRKTNKAAPRDAAAEPTTSSDVTSSDVTSSDVTSSDMASTVSGNAAAGDAVAEGEAAPDADSDASEAASAIESRDTASDDPPARGGRKGRSRAAHASAS